MDGLILLAAGASRRFGPGSSKVLRPLAATPVIVRALAPFLVAVERLAVVIVARRGDHAAIRALLPRAPVVEGGASRFESVARGLQALPAELDVILVHEAARPLTPVDVVRSVLAAARAQGAAATVVGLRDPLHHVEAGGSAGPSRFVDTVGRSQLAAAQAPQAARAALLRDALARAQAAGLAPEDEVALLLHAGVPVTAVPGDVRNLRITTPSDLAVAEALLAEP